MIMGEIYSTHGPMRAVAFDPDGNGWSLASAAKNTVIYRLPFEDDDLWKLSNGNWDDPTAGHSKGNPNGLQAFAFDFTHPEGGNIRAARGGVVHALVKSESGNSWGSSDPCNPGVGNYLVIKHSDATFGVYWHMKKNGVLVNVGNTVKRGDLIASSGNTGNSSTPHLHFEVRTIGTSRTRAATCQSSPAFGFVSRRRTTSRGFRGSATRSNRTTGSRSSRVGRRGRPCANLAQGVASNNSIRSLKRAYGAPVLGGLHAESRNESWFGDF